MRVDLVYLPYSVNMPSVSAVTTYGRSVTVLEKADIASRDHNYLSIVIDVGDRRHLAGCLQGIYAQAKSFVVTLSAEYDRRS